MEFANKAVQKIRKITVNFPKFLHPFLFSMRIALSVQKKIIEITKNKNSLVSKMPFCALSKCHLKLKKCTKAASKFEVST